MFPHHSEFQASHETVYKAIYAQPHGELRKELITCLHRGHTKRLPRAEGVDRRQQIPDLVSINLRPPEVEEWLLPEHWEGDLIKRAFNRSAVGTLVERVSGLVFLAKMDGGTTTAAVHGFSAVLNGVLLRKCARPLLTTRTRTCAPCRDHPENGNGDLLCGSPQSLAASH